MACCVVLAAVFGLVALVEALAAPWRRARSTAQEWRLNNQEEEHG